jgi:hypothetical protein
LGFSVSFSINSSLNNIFIYREACDDMEKLDENPAELDWLQTREIAIQQAIDSRDLAGLRAWSKEAGGFGSDAIRRRVW